MENPALSNITEFPEGSKETALTGTTASVPTESTVDSASIEEPAHRTDASADRKESVLDHLGLSKKEKLKKQVQQLTLDNEQLRQQVATLQDKYMRLYAELENFKKRALKERVEFSRLAGADIMLSLLPVLDDFRRAIQAMEKQQDPLAEGVRLIYQKLSTALENKGLKRMESIGQDFSPDLHEAISEIEGGEENKNKVIDEVECGYYLNDKIIRHAKVVVGK